jgi:hypothetical protein
VLGVYLAALPAVVFGALGGWLTLNLISTLASAALVYFAARRVAAPWAAALAGGLYPVLPLAFWQTAQPLTEASIALFAALLVYLATRVGHRLVEWFTLLAAVGLLALARESYLPLVFAVPIAYLALSRARGPVGRSSIGGAAALTAGSLVVLGIGDQAFGQQNVRFSIARLLHTAVPGRTDNMWFNFDLSAANVEDRLPLALDLLIAKLPQRLAEQFVAFDNPMFGLSYWIFNGLAVLAIAMLWRRRHDARARWVVAAALGPVLVHFVTIALFQNQARYTLPAIPGLLIVLAMALSAWRPDSPVLSTRLVGVGFATAAVAAVLAVASLGGQALGIRADAHRYAAAEASVADLLDRYVGPSDGLVVEYSGAPHVVAHAARPRAILHVVPTYAADELDRLLDFFAAHWVLAPINSALVARLGVAAPASGVADVLGMKWGLYRLP